MLLAQTTQDSGMAWQDQAVVLVYLVGMIALGAYLARRQKSDEEYFLAGRRMPWFPVGISVIASLLSSLTYLSEPGEVWNSGVTHVFGKMLGIPFEMLLVWVFCVPFMMRFRFTSAYEYLEHRFGRGARWLGVVMFLTMVVLWMGFVVLVSARALAEVSGFHLLTVIVTVGFVATVYTMLGGLRAVIWTDVVQVILLVGGGLFAIGYVAFSTGTWIPDWYAAAVEQLAASKSTHGSMPLFSIDPTVRATVVTVAISMCVWHVCTHTANQMTLQRYFSTRDVKAARRSFVTGSLFGVGLNLMLVVVGLAMIYYYFGQGISPPGGLDPSVKQQRDLIFPAFAIHQLAPGIGGGILAALLAAAMSSIDSGVNSIATVVTMEVRRQEQTSGSDQVTSSHVTMAKGITLVVGLFITIAAYALSFLPTDWGIVDAMPRTFNAITAPMGGLFLTGIFLRRVGGTAAVTGALLGMATSISIGYFDVYMDKFAQLGWVSHSWLAEMQLLNADGEVKSLSFTWVMPCALSVTMLGAWVLSFLERPTPRNLAGLTWWTRNEPSPLTEQMLEEK